MAEESVEVKSAGPSSPHSPHSNGGGVGGKPTGPPSPSPVRLQPRRVKLTDQQFESLTKEELALKWREQDLYVELLEAQTAAQEGTEIRRVRRTSLETNFFLLNI